MEQFSNFLINTAKLLSRKRRSSWQLQADCERLSSHIPTHCGQIPGFPVPACVGHGERDCFNVLNQINELIFDWRFLHPQFACRQWVGLVGGVIETGPPRKGQGMGLWRFKNSF